MQSHAILNVEFKRYLVSTCETKQTGFPVYNAQSWSYVLNLPLETNNAQKRSTNKLYNITVVWRSYPPCDTLS